MPYSDPKFAVIYPSPNVDNCIKSMRVRDYAFIGGITSASWGFGYIFGKPVRMPTASTAAAIGVTFAGLAILQDTRARLMGYKENQREVKIYGIYPEQPKKHVQKDPRFPIATGSASLSTKPDIKFNNYN